MFSFEFSPNIALRKWMKMKASRMIDAKYVLKKAYVGQFRLSVQKSIVG